MLTTGCQQQLISQVCTWPVTGLPTFFTPEMLTLETVVL